MNHLSSYEPDRNDPCLCGSRKRFKRCCRARYQEGPIVRATELFNEGLYPAALNACRRHLTWYILCHKAHTVPLHRDRPQQAAELVTIDIAALASLVDLLFRCYLHLGIGAEFPAVIEAVASVVADARWGDKIHYFRALWILVVQDDDAGASKEVSRVDIPRCNDSDVLGLYWSTNFQKVDFNASLDLLDRIVANAEAKSERLHYSIVKGVRFCMICEVARGVEIIQSAITVYRSADSQSRSAWGNLQLARGLETLAQFTSDLSLVKEAASEYRDLIATSRGRGVLNARLAELSESLAGCLSVLGDHANAAARYEESLSLQGSELTQLFYARAQIRAGDLDKARARLTAIDTSGFNNANMLDYALAWSVLAGISLEGRDLETAKGQLKATRSEEPFFEQYRQQWLVTLLETTPKRSNSRLGGLLRTINQYVALKPNVFGIGLDLNKILEDIGGGRHVRELTDDRSSEGTKQ